MKLLACLALALTIGVIASPSRAAEGAVQEDATRPGSTTSSDVAAAFTKCGFVDPPILLNGSTAKHNEMRQLADAVTSYLRAMKASLRCLTGTEQDLEATLSEGQRSIISTIYNNGVDQMNFVAKEYNRQLRTFNLSERTRQSLPEDLRRLGRN